MFDDQLLLEYIDTFYGYGNYKGKYWLVGMEEGGGGTFEEIDKRLQGWADGGKQEIIDLTGGYDYRTAPKDMPIPKHFAEKPKWQPTWGMLIRILLAAKGQPVPISVNDIKIYQRDNLGRPDSDNCLLELLPLPSPSIRRWLYAEHTKLAQLQTREIYKEHYAPQRAVCIRERVKAHKPAVIIFYGVNWWYRQRWEKIADVKFAEVSAGLDTYHMGSDSHTVFVITKHPAAKGITNDYFHQVGKDIASRLHQSR